MRPHQGSGMGPGTYNPDNSATKNKSPNINMGTSPSRPASFATGDPGMGPGQYDDKKNIGSDTKGFRIGEIRPQRPKEGMGPGAYDPDRADSLTK